MKERFIEFLEKNKCLEQFKENIRNDEGFDEYCNRTWTGNSKWVITAFTWMSTKQGDRFWRDLHNDWEILARKYHQEYELKLNSNN